MKIFHSTGVLLACLLLASFPLKAQYEAEVARFHQLLQERDCRSGVSMIMQRWLDHPENFPQGLNPRIVHEYLMIVSDSVQAPLTDPHEFLRALSPTCTNVNRGKRWKKADWVWHGMVYGWFEGDSLLYTSSTGTIAFGLPRRGFLTLPILQAFEPLGVRVIFRVSGGDANYVFGLAEDALWVGITSLDEPQIIAWEEFVTTCQNEFWRLITELRDW